MGKFEVSIIIPYFNNIDYLNRLLKSIGNHEDIQVLVIDDNSTKNIDEYEKLKNTPPIKNIRFLTNTSGNKGAGSSRNIGLENADGKWVIFADSDDFFVEEYYKVIKKYFKSDYDAIFFTPTSIDLSTGKLSDRHIYHENAINRYIKNKTKENEYVIRYKLYVPWSKMINKSFIDKFNIKFHEVIAKNDSYFSANVGHYMNNFITSKDVIYCATWHDNGNVTKRKDFEFVEHSTKSRIKLLKFMENKLSKEIQKIINYDSIPYYLIRDFKNAEIEKEYIEQSIQMFNEAGFKVNHFGNLYERIKDWVANKV